MYEDGKGVAQDFKKAVELYQKAANLGNGAACNNLGDKYYQGSGVTQDYQKAVELYQKAADLGNASAYYY